jgi:hypothetical protein
VIHTTCDDFRFHSSAPVPCSSSTVVRFGDPFSWLQT